MLRRAYDVYPADDESLCLAKKVTALIVSSTVTYKQAMRALEEAATMLETETRPISLQDPFQDGAEQKP